MTGCFAVAKGEFTAALDAGEVARSAKIALFAFQDSPVP